MIVCSSSIALPIKMTSNGKTKKSNVTFYYNLRHIHRSVLLQTDRRRKEHFWPKNPSLAFETKKSPGV